MTKGTNERFESWKDEKSTSRTCYEWKHDWNSLMTFPQECYVTPEYNSFITSSILYNLPRKNPFSALEFPSSIVNPSNGSYRLYRLERRNL
uniref:Uncharacterized protein n=1 Tax=Megaselia scalaris TaxID=36166 RepID=T1GXY8_MEGSC